MTIIVDTCIIIDALQNREPFAEDAMLVETAYRNNVEFIVTRNLKDYVKSKVPACLPAEILTKINTD